MWQAAGSNLNWLIYFQEQRLFHNCIKPNKEEDAGKTLTCTFETSRNRARKKKKWWKTQGKHCMLQQLGLDIYKYVPVHMFNSVWSVILRLKTVLNSKKVSLSFFLGGDWLFWTEAHRTMMVTGGNTFSFHYSSTHHPYLLIPIKGHMFFWHLLSNFIELI